MAIEGRQKPNMPRPSQRIRVKLDTKPIDYKKNNTLFANESNDS
jgi:hypothetical protein